MEKATNENVEKAGIYEVVCPLGRLTAKDLYLSQSIPDLRGKTICGSGHSFNGDEAVAAVAELLRKQYPALKFIPNTEIPADVATDEEITQLQKVLRQKGCDALISGMGC